MTQKRWLSAGSIALLGLVLTFGIASAHTGVSAGNYSIEVGWLDEPPVAGQRNAVVVNVADTTAPEAAVDVSALTVTVVYGDESKLLALQPLGEGAANRYIAPLVPTVPGVYTVQLRGKLGDTPVNSDVRIEAVVAASALAFPSSNGTVPGGAGVGFQGGAGGGFQRGGNFGTGGFAFRVIDWYGIAGIALGLIALVVSILAYRRKPA